MKRLVKNDERVLLGVCGALAEYFNVDVVIVRILMAIFICGTWVGLFAYILAGILIPN